MTGYIIKLRHIYFNYGGNNFDKFYRIYDTKEEATQIMLEARKTMWFAGKVVKATRAIIRDYVLFLDTGGPLSDNLAEWRNKIAPKRTRKKKVENVNQIQVQVSNS